jgi:outer membrane protein TolC
MKLFFKKYIVLLLLVIAKLTVNSQQEYKVSLDTVLKLTEASNLTIREYDLKYKLALAEQSKANEWWLPDIYAGGSTHYLTGAAMNTDGKIFSHINQNNLWVGLGFFAEMDFNKGIYYFQAAKQNAMAAKHFYSAEKNKTTLIAVQTYFDLQKDQSQFFFMQQLVNQADTLSQQIKIKVDAGLLYQSDYLISQSNYNHLKISMLQSKIEWQKKSAELANLLNLDTNINLISADTFVVPLSFAVETAEMNGFKKRPEFLAIATEFQSIQMLRKTVTQGFLLPRLRLGSDNGAFGAYKTSPYNTYQLNVSIIWSLPLGRLTFKSDLKKYNTQILIQQNKIEQFKNQYKQEILVARSQLEIANEQMNIAGQALQFSKEALNQSLERQKLGTAKAFEVFQAQEFYLQSEIDYLKSVTEYNKAQFALKYAIAGIL